LNKSIETAQKRVEGRNYTIRKHTLEYDDVMNKQRQEIYSFRNELLHTQKPIDLALDTVEQMIQRAADHFLTNTNDEAREQFRQWLAAAAPVGLDDAVLHRPGANADLIGQLSADRVTTALREKLAFEVKTIAEATGGAAGDPEKIVQEVVRSIMVRTIDNLWQHHLLEMDHLRNDVHLRAIGQKDPLIEFKHEAFRLFDVFTMHLQEDMVRSLFKFHVLVQPQHDFTAEAEEEGDEVEFEQERSFASEIEEDPQGDVELSELPVTPIHVEAHVGRNDPCPCGSGKKYKKCCGSDGEQGEGSETEAS
jgi:preprotein translocase subunit SecA